MVIVHLSDIHLNKENLNDFNDFAMPALLDDLEKYNSKKKIDLILITGDLIDKGGKSFGEIENAFKAFEENVIKRIQNILKLSNDRFYFAPGNHDVYRDADSEITEEGLIRCLNNNEKLNKFITENNTEGIKRIFPYKEFEKSFYENFNNEKNVSNFQSCYVIEINGKSIGINCLNTAWRCYDSKTDKGKILLGERQIIEGYKLIKKCDIKIALIHHHIDWLADFDKESSSSFIHKYYDAVFCGHVHKGDFWTTSNSNGEIFISVAPQNWAGNVRSTSRIYSNGYSIIDYNIELGKVFVDYRRYHQKSIKYVTNTDLGNDGKDEFYIKFKNYRKKANNSEDNSIKSVMKISNTERGGVKYLKNNNIIDEFAVKKRINSIGFMKYKQTIKGIIEVVSKYSNRYKDLINDLDQLIILIDKLLYGFSLEGKNNQFINMFINLDECFSKIENSSENKIHELNLIYNSICQFWKKVLMGVIHEKFNGEIILPNFIDQIINLGGIDCIDDQYIKILTEAKQTYIALDSGNDYEISKNSDISLKCQIMLCIIFPTYLYRKKIMDWSSELQIGEVEDSEMDKLLKSVRNEYIDLQSNFFERSISIESVYNKVINNKITIIKGKSGSGKSTVIAKVIEKLSNEKYGNKFSSSVIIHSFAHSKNIHDLVKSIVMQCNSTLVYKIDAEILLEVQAEFNLWANNQAEINTSKFNNIYDVYKKIIKEVVNNFINEHGEIYIFIDSFELVSINENEMGRLFTDLPVNSHIVICTGENNEGIKDIISDSSIEYDIIEIRYLNLKEISCAFNMCYEKEDDAKIIDKIYEKTNGNIKLIKDLIKKSHESDLDILNLLENDVNEFEMQSSKLYNNLANEWILFSTDVLEETLLFLSVFESIDFIRYEKLQSFLNYKGYNLRLPKIKKFLRKVDKQITFTTNNKIKLCNKEFADFVVNKFFSKKDVENFITDLFSWICKCLERNYNFTVDFFKYLIKKKLIDKTLFNDQINRFIAQKKEDNKGQYLFDIGLLMLGENKYIMKYAIKMIESATLLNVSDAKGFLGSCLLRGKYIEQDISRGEVMLNEACESGNAKAKAIFGQILIEGEYLNRDSERGRKLLYESSKQGNVGAKLYLATILVTGFGIKPNSIKGRELLYELIKDNNARAMLLMGIFMIDGVSMQKKTDEGLKLINHAIECGNLDAKFELAERLIYGYGILQNKSEGLRLLKELLDIGSIEAKRALAKIYILDGYIERGRQMFDELIRNNDSKSILEYSRLIMDGKILEEKKLRAKELLESEIKKNNKDAMRELGMRLLEGDGIKKDEERGIKLLKSAISLFDVDSMRELGYKFVNGIDVIQNREQGEALLQEAVKRGDVIAKTLYGKTLIDNYTDKDSKNKGIQLLEEAVAFGNIFAKLNLSNILFDGNIIQRNTARGLKLLEDCIDSGDIQAARILGSRLLNGDGVPRDVDNAKDLLLKAIAKDDDLARTIFGEAIILGDIKGFTIEYGLVLLEQATLKEQIARKVLGTLLIKGINITQDKQKGEVLLKSSAESGNIAAMRELYDMLLDGRFLNQNIEEGKKYLMKAVESGDELSKIDFAQRLLDGDKLLKDVKKGEQIFNDLIAENNSYAMYLYGERLISGNGLAQDKSRGEKLLRESMLLNDLDAKRNLALNIIDGKIGASNKDEAIMLLEENISELDETTMIVYGEMLIDGEKVQVNVDRGIELLENCVKLNNSIGKYFLGKRLLEGKKIGQNIERGITLVLDSSNSGNEKAAIYLSNLYFCGKYIKRNTQKGLEILNKLIADGNENAQALLGYRLIKGDRIKRDRDKGIHLLNNILEGKNYDVMEVYGGMLLDGFFVERDAIYGQMLLNDAIKNGNYYASYILGGRLLNGDGIKKNKSRGVKELKRAMRHNIINAIFEYGIRQKNGVSIAKNIKEGSNKIERVLNIADIEQKYSLGVIAYEFKDYELATKLFYDAYIGNFEEASVSLAYMLRRNEIQGQINLPDIYSILEKPLKNNDHNAYINLALCYIKKNEKNQDWEKVDKIFKNLDYCGDAVEWWYDISKHGDFEGELVLGLMDRYGLIPGLSDISFSERFKKLNTNGWSIPNWMFNKITDCEEVASTKEH
jgi:TPR repeat protein/predicted MPP superfamily phosphohydrolase